MKMGIGLLDAVTITDSLVAINLKYLVNILPKFLNLFFLQDTRRILSSNSMKTIKIQGERKITKEKAEKWYV